MRSRRRTRARLPDSTRCATWIGGRAPPRATSRPYGKIGILTSFFAFIFVLGVLIFVHELGHFLMARRIGVRVLTFSLGFGPKLLNVRRGDTEYCISAI